MKRYIVKTEVHGSEALDFTNYLADNNVYQVEVNIDQTTLLVYLTFDDRDDAICFVLKGIEDYYHAFKPFYFEPDEDFEEDLERWLGTYSECDEYFERHLKE